MQRKIIALIAAFGLMTATLVGCSGSNNSGSEGGGSSNEATAPQDPTFDVPFEFDDLTLTFGSNIATTTLDNQFSDHNGATVLAVPITMTNNSSDTHGLNMFYFKAYGPSGTQLSTISTYFMENDIEWAGDIRSGATTDSTMHLLYEGDGDYYVEFSSFSEKIEVKLPITLG